MPKKPYKPLPLRAVHNLAFDAHTGVSKTYAVQKARKVEPQTPPHMIRKLFDRFAGMETEEQVRKQLADYERRQKVKTAYWSRFSSEERTRMRKESVEHIPVEKRRESARRAKQTWMAQTTPEERRASMTRDRETLRQAQRTHWSKVAVAERIKHMKPASARFSTWIKEKGNRELMQKLAKDRQAKLGAKKRASIAKKRRKKLGKERRKEIAQKMLKTRGGVKVLRTLREHSAVQQGRIASAMQHILKLIAVPKEPTYVLVKELGKARTRKNYPTAAAMCVELAMRAAQNQRNPRVIQTHLNKAIGFLEMEIKKLEQHPTEVLADTEKELSIRGLMETLRVLANAPKTFAYRIRRKK
ncbi:MAG: hypothetical protein Q7S92_01265 [Candidatus Diapherotrites archaeon]|nr:hypothetical protein [Candidatus Diapherotrites archaeon]